MVRTIMKLADGGEWVDPKHFSEFVFVLDTGKRIGNDIWSISYDRAKIQAKMYSEYKGKAVTVCGVTRQGVSYNRIDGKVVPVEKFYKYPFVRFSNGKETKPKF